MPPPTMRRQKSSSQDTKQGGAEMESPWISLYVANKVYTWGWYLSVIGAAVTAFGVILLMVGTRVRDRDAETQIANLHKSAADSEERSRVLENSNLQLKLQLANIREHRHLTDPQKRSLTTSLGRIANKGEIVVMGNFNDLESTDYAAEIKEFLPSVGFTPVETKQKQKVLSLSNVGIGLLVRDIHAPPPIAAELFNAFRAAGIEIRAYPQPDMEPPDMVWISTGARF